MTGTLHGVGVGPGDPALMTVRAVELVRAADVVAYHCARHGRSNARAIVALHLGTQVEEQLTYPVTTESTDDYQGALDAFYAEAAARLADGQTTGGAAIRGRHRRPTPVGGTVDVYATLTTEGDRLTFDVSAIDGDGHYVADGEIDRVVVDRAQFTG